MFTGIVTEIGKITKIAKSEKSITFAVATDAILQNKKIGDSIAVNGVCVTITHMDDKIFHFDAIQETLDRTNFNNLEEGSKVNLEPALQFNQSLDGHLMQGHVDTIGTVKSFDQKGQYIRITINFPKEIEQYLAFKGSIAINGVSLTISDLQLDNFSVDLIPHTLENTNLGELQKDSKVNLEVDIIARYLERMIHDKEKETKFNFLKERGFL